MTMVEGVGNQHSIIFFAFDFREIKEVPDSLMKKGNPLRNATYLKGLWIHLESNIQALLATLTGVTGTVVAKTTEVICLQANIC